MQRKYEVQTDTLCQGWVNCWSVDDETEYFDTREEAEEALRDFLECTEEAGMQYDREDYRIMEVWIGEEDVT